MTIPNVLEAVELLLAATFNGRGNGRRLSFLFGKPGASIHDRRLGTELCMGRVELLKAALFVRAKGPAYLRNLSIHEIEGMLTHFLTENYGYISEETWLTQFSDAFASHVSPASKQRLAEALNASEIFSPRNVPTVFPLVPIQVEADFDSEPFFLVKAASLNATRLRRTLIARDLLPDQFPPFPDWKGAYKSPASWLGVRAPRRSTSKKMRNAILGALALLPHPRERHQFTLRKVFGGEATLDEGWTISFGEAHTPRLSEDIIVNAADHAWLTILAFKLQDPTDEARRHIKALEYYYRAWPLDEVERFPVLFMSIDAIFGDSSRATQAVIDAVGPLMGSAYDYDRLRLLLSLRASVIHGGAPDVYESSKYFNYYRRYGEDPIYDLELIVARCLQSVVFDGALTSRPHTYAHLIKQEMGVDI